MVTITILGHFFLSHFQEVFKMIGSVWKPAGSFVSHLKIAFDPESTLRIPLKHCKKGVPRNFAKFTGKHLCQSLFFN